jgi:hypothetical protein
MAEEDVPTDVAGTAEEESEADDDSNELDDDNEDGMGPDADEDVPTLLEDAALDPDRAELAPAMLVLPDVGSPSDEDRALKDVPPLLLLLPWDALDEPTLPPPEDEDDDEDEVLGSGGTHTLDWHTSPPLQGVTPSHAARQMPDTHAALGQPWSLVQRGRHWPPAHP